MDNFCIGEGNNFLIAAGALSGGLIITAAQTHQTHQNYYWQLQGIHAYLFLSLIWLFLAVITQPKSVEDVHKSFFSGFKNGGAFASMVTSILMLIILSADSSLSNRLGLDNDLPYYHLSMVSFIVMLANAITCHDFQYQFRVSQMAIRPRR
jgi:DMSO/TMAO reductase YedYZ heme-binding membrane subunit